MLVFTLLCLFAGSVLAASTPQTPPKEIYDLEQAEHLFEQFIKEHNKIYENEEVKQKKFEIFKQNLMEINKMNTVSKHTVFGISAFTDMTKEEFKKWNTGLILGNDGKPCTMRKELTFGFAPDSIDWRDENKVTKVKNQKRCGSCWAFSTIANVESQYAIKHNELVEFSEQQLVDCDLGDGGCNGGSMNNAIHYLSQSGGMTEADYKYLARRGKCKFAKDKVKVHVSGCLNFTKINEEQLKHVLVNTGPLAFGMVVSSDVIFYKSGVVTKCRDKWGLHGVLLVGYGTERDVPYWLVKNSWGEAYGERGYFKIKRGENMCNMTDLQIVSAIVS